MAPENGEVDFRDTIVGSQAVYSCEVGFMLEGAEIRTCLESGKWSDEDPTCKGIGGWGCCLSSLNAKQA